MPYTVGAPVSRRAWMMGRPIARLLTIGLRRMAPAILRQRSINITNTLA